MPTLLRKQGRAAVGRARRTEHFAGRPCCSPAPPGQPVAPRARPTRPGLSRRRANPCSELSLNGARTRRRDLPSGWGLRPRVLDHEISLPVRSGEEQNVRDFFGQAAGQGAHAMLTVRPPWRWARWMPQPQGPSPAKAKELASAFRGTLLIRFAPDMNSSWVEWGQQPAAYKEAFRTIAAEFKTADDAGTVMVWQPYLGRDYPFERHRDAPAAGIRGIRPAGHQRGRTLERCRRGIRALLPRR